MDSNPPSPQNNTSGLASDKEMLGKVARTMYTQSLALNEKIRTLSILQAIDTIILESNRGLKVLGTDIASAITNSSKFSLVAVFSKETIESDTVNFQGWSINKKRADYTPDEAFLSQLVATKLDISNEWLNGPDRHSIVTLGSLDEQSLAGLYEQNTADLFKQFHKKLALNCLYATKLIVSDTLVGFLLIGLEEPAPHIDDIELIERIAKTTGIALYNRLLFEENLKNIEELKVSNSKLKAIDESKDEFIALASHQMRTPLTTMKGYLSMVLDGQYGPLSPEQQTALQRSFNSTQRMVYLISDLLNVSRLNTGKFVIDNSQTDLSAVVKEEFTQLQDTAASKKLVLVFNQHGKIPQLSLDATKIRQVIMNFIDNAIYYTPTGGMVTVELSMSEKFVDFTVTDSGVGVPIAEQQYLFKKFFRASNARQSRPDGTGLGLFMAAKVITAQGGQILFASKEGTGSIFGFRLPI